MRKSRAYYSDSIRLVKRFYSILENQNWLCRVQRRETIIHRSSNRRGPNSIALTRNHCTGYELRYLSKHFAVFASHVFVAKATQTGHSIEVALPYSTPFFTRAHLTRSPGHSRGVSSVYRHKTHVCAPACMHDARVWKLQDARCLLSLSVAQKADRDH